MGQHLSPRKEVKDRPAQTPNVVFMVASFVGYDQRSSKNYFQQRLIFY